MNNISILQGKELKRIVNKTLLKEYRQKPCRLCGSRIGVCAHHIKTKKSGGHDHKLNLIALCINCHVQIHAHGLNRMIEVFPKLKFFLKGRFFEQDPISRKWFQQERVYDEQDI